MLHNEASIFNLLKDFKGYKAFMLKPLLFQGSCDSRYTYQGYAEVTAVDNTHNSLKVAVLFW